MRKYTQGLLVVCAGMLLTSGLRADDKTPAASVQIQVNKVAEGGAIPLRASTLVGMNVRDSSGKVIGSINDFVVDLKNDRIRYLAVSYGGFLGLGDKLFAVPTSAFDLRRDADTDTHYLVLDIPEDRLKNAPGFDQGKWPNFADMKWQIEVDDYYRSHIKSIPSTVK